MRLVPSTGSKKKLYDPPRLSVYGDLAHMTKAGPNHMNNHDAGNTGPKT